jgi:hypothetical protein
MTATGHRRVGHWVLVVLMTGAPAGSAAAQQLSFTPQIGFYIPTEKLADLATGGDVSELEAGPSFGGRLGLWFGSRVGIEAAGSYVPTTFKLDQGTQQMVSEDAKLFIGSGQLVVFLLPRTGLLSLWLSGGVGVVSRGGVAFTASAHKTDVAGTVGAGAGLNLGPIALNVGADFLGYSAAYASSTQTIAEVRQRDVHLKLGFGIPFGGAGPSTK